MPTADATPAGMLLIVDSDGATSATRHEMHYLNLSAHVLARMTSYIIVQYLSHRMGTPGHNFAERAFPELKARSPKRRRQQYLLLLNLLMKRWPDYH